MRKRISLLFLLASLLTLAGCAETETKTPETAAAVLTAETTEADNPVQEAIVAACGIPFRFNSPTNRDVYMVKFYEDYARREVWTKYDVDEEQDGLAWEIRGDQMILSGEWSETFTIDLETMEAVSNMDGRVYRILKVDKVEE